MNPPVVLRTRDTESREAGVAVIGADGFIGSHLLRGLRLAGYSAASCGPGRMPPPNVQTIYFVAGRVTPSNAAHSPGQVAAEVESFRHLLTSVRCPANLTRVVLASSGGTIYSPTAQPPYREDHPVAPNNAYGRMKLEMESILRAQVGVEPVIVRLANVYGPGQQARRGLGVIAHWIEALKTGEPIVLHGHPGSTRDYLYIDDATDLLVRIHAADTVPPVLNAGSGTPTPLAELAQLTLQTAGRPDLPVQYSPARGADRMHVWLDIELTRTTVGWMPSTNLTEGLRQTWVHTTLGPTTPATQTQPAGHPWAPRIPIR